MNRSHIITAAADEGLYVLIELADGPWSASQYADLSEQSYLDNTTYYLDSVIPKLRALPNVVGWVISTVDETRCTSNGESLPIPAQATTTPETGEMVRPRLEACSIGITR